MIVSAIGVVALALMVGVFIGLVLVAKDHGR